MPLQAVNFVPNGPDKSADHLQFFNLFTGAMVDQPVTFANILTVGGSQGVGSAPLKVQGVAAQTANMVELRTLAADVQPRMSIDKTGTINWGPGGGTGTDVSLSRSGANQLTLTGLVGTPALIVPVGGVQVTAGGVGIGRAPSASGQLFIQGTTADSSLFGFNVANSTPANLLQVRNDGVVTVNVGPLNVAAGGEVIAAGDLALTTGKLTFGTANSVILPGSASISFNNNANSATNFSITDAGAVNISRGNLFVAGQVGISTAVVATTGLTLQGPGNSNSTYTLTAYNSSPTLLFSVRNDGQVVVAPAAGFVGFFGSAGSAKLSVSGSRGGNVALASLLTTLASYGLLVDGSSA